MRPFFGPDDDERTDNEGQRHGQRLKQVCLDDLAEGQSQYGQGQERHRHVEDELPRFPLTRQSRHHLPKPLAVFPAHRQDGARLDHDLEQLAALIVEIEQVAGQDQMAGTRNGQELGQAFHKA